MQVQRYYEASRELLAQGFEELSKGDLRQASEEGWGATAQIVKAVSEQRGWEHVSHGGLRRTASLLSRETNDPDLWRLFRVASDLQTNWYENWDDADSVAYGLRDVEQFIAKLEPVLQGC